MTNLLSAFDVRKLSEAASPLGTQYAEIPESLVRTLPQQSGYGCKDTGIVPTDLQLEIQNAIPADFNAGPRTNPTNK